MGEDDLQNGPGVPTSLSALSIIPVGRRLVKSTRMGKGASSGVPRYRDSDLSTVEENIQTTRDETRPSDAAYSHNLDQRLSSQSAAFGRIAEILHARWSQRNLYQRAPSLSSYGSDDNNARVGSSAGQANFTFHFNRSMTESIEQRLCPSVIDHDSRG
ncbi:hypothetical protein FS842_006112 [Serendipita sp. 407]|nr:hypothetical protein FS842_006112 [Serendipita sp. 407]